MLGADVHLLKPDVPFHLEWHNHIYTYDIKNRDREAHYIPLRDL